MHDSGSRSKTPPPYSASQPVVDSSAPPSKKQGKKSKNIAAFASSIEAPNQLNFVQHEDGKHFGFHPPIVPSHKEQVLHTSITAKSASQKPTTMSIDTSSQSDLSKSTSVNTMPHSQADFFANLDPSLWPIRQEAQGEANYCGASLPSIAQEAQAKVSTSEDDNDNSSTDDADKSDTDEESENDDGKIGWGGDHGCHSVHSSFSKEGISASQPQAIALPSDFEFQYSREEDENLASESLAVGDKTSSSNDVMDEPTKPEDVLQGHHKKNGRPC
ncbi:hypothetical protein DFH29DRAFT_997820 [Suillus ampliporus]|nr:hypothetical protein DFH29DRAFT_997820 [Suillus ampliporus]